VAPAVPGRPPVDLRRAAELAAPPHDRGVQQAPVAEVLEERRHAGVELGELGAHRLEVLFVGVPSPGVDGHIRDAALDQPPRHQARLAEGVAAVLLPHLVVLVGEVEDLASLAEDEVVGRLLALAESLELWVVLDGAPQRVEVVEQAAPQLLPLARDAWGGDALDEEHRPRRVASRGEGLVRRAEEPRFGEAPLGPGEHHVGRDEALVAGLVALEQRDHGADARVDHPAAGLPPRLHDVGRGLVAVDAVGHAADDGVLVGLFRQQGEGGVDRDAVDVGGDHLVEWPAVGLAGVGLGVEGVEVGRAAPHP